MSRRQNKNEREAQFWEKAFGKDNVISKSLRRANKNIDRRKKAQFKHATEIRSN